MSKTIYVFDGRTDDLIRRATREDIAMGSKSKRTYLGTMGEDRNGNEISVALTDAEIAIVAAEAR